jgi:hypothetical protein
MAASSTWHAACLLAALLFLTACSWTEASAAAAADADGEEEDEEVDHASSGINCEDGLIVPLWPGTDEMSPGDR